MYDVPGPVYAARNSFVNSAMLCRLRSYTTDAVTTLSERCAR